MAEENFIEILKDQLAQSGFDHNLGMISSKETDESNLKEPTAEELVNKFLAPIKLEYRIKKSNAIVLEKKEPEVQDVESSGNADPETEDLNQKDDSKDNKRRKDIRGQNRDSKRHKGYETVQSIRCTRLCSVYLNLL